MKKIVLFISFLLILFSFSLFLFKEDLESFLKTALRLKKINELESQSLVEEIKKEDGEYNWQAKEAVFNNSPVSLPQEELSVAEKAILGSKIETGDEKWIEIDLSEQKLTAHEGDKIIYTFLISSGKWAPTPTGEFRIWIKLRYALMKGGKKELGTYYYLPNVPYTQYFYKGYGVHGTYWHNNFGQPMSHGCVNLSIPDAEKLFYWTHPLISSGIQVAYPSSEDKGTRVVIHQ